MVAVRSTWDYEEPAATEFLAWAARRSSRGRLLNGAEVFAWNTDKAYLLDLARPALPVVPTVLLDDRGRAGRRPSPTFAGRVW